MALGVDGVLVGGVDARQVLEEADQGQDEAARDELRCGGGGMSGGAPSSWTTDNGSMAAATWQWAYLHAFEVEDVLDELELVGGTWEDHEEEHDCAVHHADAVDGHGRRDGENPVKRVLHLAPP